MPFSSVKTVNPIRKLKRGSNYYLSLCNQEGLRAFSESLAQLMSGTMLSLKTRITVYGMTMTCQSPINGQTSISIKDTFLMTKYFSSDRTTENSTALQLPSGQKEPIKKFYYFYAASASFGKLNGKRSEVTCH